MMSPERLLEELPVSHLRQYELIRFIGRGRASALYLAREPALNRQVAIKLLNPELASDANEVWRFFSHAASAARVTQANIAPIYFVGQDGPYCFCAREFINGVSLANRLKNGDAFTSVELLDVCRQILQALSATHALGIVHGNLEAHNVLFDPILNRVLLTDFQGSRTSVTDSDKTQNENIDKAAVQSDLRQLGDLLQRMLPQVDMKADLNDAHEELFQISKEPASKTADIHNFVGQLISTKSIHQFSSAADALETLHRLLGNKSGSTESSEFTAIPFSSVQNAGSGAQTRARTAVIELPEVDDVPELSEVLFQAPPVTGVALWRQRIADCLRWRTPKSLQRLQDTHAAVDGAIAELNQRLGWLNRLVQEGQTVVQNLQSQLREASPNQHTKEGSELCAMLTADLAERRRQLESAENRRATLNQTVERLKQQRDALLRRLRITRAPVRNSDGKTRKTFITASTLVQGTLVAALFLVAAYLYRDHLLQVPPSVQSVPVAVAPVLPLSKRPPIDNGLSWVPVEMTDIPVRQLHSTRLGNIETLSFSPKQPIVAAGSHDGTVRTWSVETGRELSQYLHLVRGSVPQPVTDILFNSDGESLAVNVPASYENFFFYHLPSGGIQRQMEGKQIRVSSLAFCHDKQLIAAVVAHFFTGKNRSITLFDKLTGLPSQRIASDDDNLEQVVCSPTSPLLAFHSKSDQITLWDYHEHRQTRVISKAGVKIQDIAFSPNGKLLAAACHDAGIWVWDAANGKEEFHLGVTKPDTCQKVQFSPNGRLLAGLGYGIVTLCNMDRKQVLRHLVAYHTKISFSSDSCYLITAGGYVVGVNANMTTQDIPLVWDVSDLSTEPIANTDGGGREQTTMQYSPASRNQQTALRKLRHLLATDQTYFQDAEFRDNLEIAAPTFAKADVSGDISGPAEWNEITLNQSGLGIDGIRFTASLNEPADLYWCCHYPENLNSVVLAGANGIIPESTRYRTEFNLSIPELRVSDANTFKFQHIPGGKLRPGKEYTLLCRLDTKEPVRFRCALRLKPAQIVAEDDLELGETPADGVAIALGWPKPLPHTRIPEIMSRQDFAAVPVNQFDFRPELSFSLNRCPPVWVRNYATKEQ